MEMEPGKWAGRRGDLVDRKMMSAVVDNDNRCYAAPVVAAVRRRWVRA